ncbi:hypothetical protein F5Y15DRAFT_208185 [Xylariaceae sp. FL0016]|nr:hypothetical protein F5Y15DRAFT_208185 [Xylariaceae sp. FL0016]
MSTYSSSGASRVATAVGYARKMSLTPKPCMKVQIDNHYRYKVYSTSSEVSGHVEISPTSDVRFDGIQIVLLGTSKTRVDAINIPQATSHTFLKLTMPIPESTYPVPRILEAGRTYKVPFTFVIPKHLTLNACNHNVCNASVQEHHVRLPPSVGNWEKDDCAPNMSRISYCVKGRLLRNEEIGGANEKIMEASTEIKVLPTTPEDAPLNVTKQDRLYTMSKSKSLRKSILSPKTGKVTISATQPAPAMLSPDGHSITPTTAQLTLDFEPSSCDAQPPRVTGISSKVTAVTFFSAGGINHYPNLKDWPGSFGAEGRGSYSNTVSVPTAPVGPLDWQQHLTAQARRDSGYGTDAPSDSEPHSSSSRAPSPTLAAAAMKKRGSKAAPPYYQTASLHVPIQLPAHKKQFLPTFHSCISSRAYVLWLTVSLSSGAGAGGGTSSSLTLGVPLQVGVAAGRPPAADATGLPSFEAAMEAAEEAEADAFLRPRTLGRRPSVELAREAGRDVLPGYGDIVGRRRTAVAAR